MICLPIVESSSITNNSRDSKSNLDLKLRSSVSLRSTRASIAWSPFFPTLKAKVLCIVLLSGKDAEATPVSAQDDKGNPWRSMLSWMALMRNVFPVPRPPCTKIRGGTGRRAAVAFEWASSSKYSSNIFQIASMIFHFLQRLLVLFASSLGGSRLRPVCRRRRK